MRAVVSTVLILGLFTVLARSEFNRQVYQGQPGGNVPAPNPAVRQAYHDYLMDTLSTLQKQMVQDPQTMEEQMYNARLQRQATNIRNVILLENEFVFGLKPYIRADNITSTTPPPAG